MSLTSYRAAPPRVTRFLPWQNTDKANTSCLRYYQRKSVWICRLYPTFAQQNVVFFGYFASYFRGANAKRPLVAALCIGWAEVRDYEKILCCVLQTWQRPTLPRLETEYHWRWGVSRPCSERERVRPPRDNHQVGKTQHVIHAERMETVVSRSWEAFASFNLTRLSATHPYVFHTGR